MRAGLIALRFSTLHRWSRTAAAFLHTAPSRSETVARVAWALAAVARRSPIYSTCLTESLVVDLMLRRRGYASDIRFGVQPPGGGRLTAHAWVEHDGVIVFGGRPELAGYAALSARGAE